MLLLQRKRELIKNTFQFTNAFPYSSESTVVKKNNMKILAPQQSELEELAGEKKYRAMVTEK